MPSGFLSTALFLIPRIPIAWEGQCRLPQLWYSWVCSSLHRVMGSLFAFNTRTDPGQKKMYGVSGNSYVAIVEFGPKIKARSIHYFGYSYDPASPHYFDQSHLYAQGKFEKVYFYKKDVLKHAERTYHPGE